MRLAIVGSNSFIARNFLAYLANKGHEVVLYDCQNRHLDGLDHYTQVNLLDEREIEKIDFSCDVIYYFTGRTGTEIGFKEPISFVKINECALLHLLNGYIKSGSKARIVYPSSRLVYKGDEFNLLKEEAEKEAKTIYAVNKLASEYYLKAYCNAYGLKYCILRIGVPYGSLIPNASSYGTLGLFINKASKGDDIVIFGDGKIYRTFVSLIDLCEVLHAAGYAKKCENDVFNVGGTKASLNEIAEIVAAKYNVGVSHVPWPAVAKAIESGSTAFDSSKLEKAIGKCEYRSVFDWAVEEN